MINYKDLGYSAFKALDFENAKLYFSLAINKTNKEEIYFLINLCELAKSQNKEARMLFDFYMFSKDELNLEELNSIFNEIEHTSFEESIDNIIKSEDAVTYDEFKNIVLKKVNFKDGLEGVMVSTKLIIQNTQSFLDFIEHLLDNGLESTGVEYFESFLQINGSAYPKAKFIAQKIKDYENRSKK
ncbi:hypothetical protein [Campylobacter ureolyticus]|uniref:hypothetical protein n=1 Tax=Campylobacter ureolyticus TaxID=827 RepID=UPI00046912F4|nr:hypothetical protein [Campylobacter ureolyticus]QIX86383.1 hypothetical protein FOB81_03435 [Campylobacter ureolyticus]STA69815.1 two-component sensor kinase CzcS [Campylobacter ureolyticus]